MGLLITIAQLIAYRMTQSYRIGTGNKSIPPNVLLIPTLSGAQAIIRLLLKASGNNQFRDHIASNKWEFQTELHDLRYKNGPIVSPTHGFS